MDSRLDSILQMLIEFSGGNFDVRGEVTLEDDPLNTVVSGLNMLGEELAHYNSELTRQNNFLQNIFTSINEVVYVRVIDHANPYLSPFSFVSERAKDIIGISSQELYETADKWLNIIHPEDKAYTAAIIKKLLAGEEHSFIYRIFHADKKQYCWIEDKVVPQRNADGVVAIAYGSARDITEQHEASIELEEKSQFISRIITSSDQFFYIASINPEDASVNKFTYVSWQVEKIQGSTPGELKKKPQSWASAIYPADVVGINESNKLILTVQKPVTRIYRVRHARTGVLIWLEDYVVPVADDTGRITELYGSARDITARKMAELEREKLLVDLNSKYTELMQYNYIVSHNLRSPVASILGLAAMLNEDTPDKDIHDINAFILRAARDMDEVLHDLNKILSSRAALTEKLESVVLQDVVDSVCSSLKTEIDSTNTKIIVNINPAVARIHSIKSYLQSAFYNLISNAIKYRAEGVLPIVNVDVSSADKSVIIVVKDNGRGIDLKTHGDNIFSLYTRFDLTTDGKGLGLYMTKMQVESLGGTITVDSKESEGAAFTIILPLVS